MGLDVRYRPGDAAWNLILRNALWDAWHYRCCWCKKPKDLQDVDVDHLIPQSYSGDELRTMLDENLTEELRTLRFDIHAPHNLGPACRDCNGEKSNRDFLTAPRFMALLARARELEPAVVQAVRKFHSDNAFTKALATLTGADLSNPDLMETLNELGPALITRLRYIAPHIVEGPSNYGYFDPDGWDSDNDYLVTITFDESSRRARVVLEDVYGCDFDSTMVTVVRAVANRICEELAATMAHELSVSGCDPDVGPVQARIELGISGLAFDPVDNNFDVQGAYQADGSAFVAVQNYRNDSGTSERQREADIQGDFTVSFYPEDDANLVVSYVDLRTVRPRQGRK